MRITDAMVKAANEVRIAEMYERDRTKSMTDAQWDEHTERAMRAALEAALSVADAPAPDDAFVAVLDQLINQSYNHGYRDAVHEENPLNEPDGAEKQGEVIQTQQHVIALHRQTKHAGLIEAKRRIEAGRSDPRESLNRGIGWQSGNKWAVEQIDAMLKEATDAR